MRANNDFILVMKNITKFFPPNILANNHVNFNLRRGEIHALLGENGAGKSTLARILYGECKPDEGEIYLKGRKVRIRNPMDAIRMGIGMVHQHFRLVDTLTVAENIALSYTCKQFFPTREVRSKLLEYSKKYGLKVDPDAYIWQLSVGERQRVAILKALYNNVEILILDESTSVLSPIERKRFFNIINKMRENGCSIIFITHRLDEAMRCDRITLLRNGCVIATVTSYEVSKEDLARMMIGRKMIFLSENRGRKNVCEKPILMVRNLYVINDRGIYAVKGVSFEVKVGEIFGIAGIAGNGQRELIEAITGLRRIDKGKVIIFDRDVTNASAREIMELGVAHIPEDRLNLGLVSKLTLTENYLLTKYYRKKYRYGFFIKYDKAEKELYDAIKKYRIMAPGPDVPVMLLSGGNMQKLILARELSGGRRLIIAMHPTYGLDIATTEFIRKILLKERDRGVGILLVSEDLDEILRLSDRVAVIYDGRIVKIFDSNKIDLEELGLLMAGEGEKYDNN